MQFDRLGDELAVVMLAVPLDRSSNARELSRISIAVRRVDRSKFREFHNWMFQSDRTVSAAREMADQLVGRVRMEAELALQTDGKYIDGI